MLILPTDLGFPTKFKSWRPNQKLAIEDGLSSRKRFVGTLLSPGEGKSLIYMSSALLTKSRTMVLTGTKGLQTQLVSDFGSMGLVDIRGKSNYHCDYLPGHSCEDGYIGKCAYKGSTLCSWNAAKEASWNAQYVTTNYSCWTATNKYGMGFGTFDHLVLDEAHNTVDFLNKAMQVTLGDREIKESLKFKWPDSGKTTDMEAWKSWALIARARAEMLVQGLKDKIERTAKPSQQMIKDFRHFKNISRKLADVATAKIDNWVPDDWTYGYRFDPIDTSIYGERILFRDIPRVTFYSGTIKRRTLEMCGIDPDDMDFFDYPVKVDVSRSPLIHIPTAWVGRNSSDMDLKAIVRRVDEIIESRADRRIIIHTVSGSNGLALRDYIISHSKYSRFMLSNYTTKGDVTADIIEQFKKAKPPIVLVSPSVTTGYDFPHDACRVQIIVKLPFPDFFSAKVERAREKLDPGRGIYHMWQTLAQMFKRGDRAEDDFQEVFVLDNNIQREMTMHADMAPSWLPAYYRVMHEVPMAPYIN